MSDKDKIVGHDGQFERIPAHKLSIDGEYQRFRNDNRVSTMIRDYDKDVFGVLICSFRENGEIFVIDGQHRLDAAKMMFGDDAMLPCFVMLGLTDEDEARIFWKLNKFRLHPSSADTFKARLRAKEEVAEDIKKICDEVGVNIVLYPMPLGPRDVAAFTLLEDIYKDGMLREVLTVIHSAWPREPGALKSKHLGGVHRMLQEFSGKFFDDPHGPVRVSRLIDAMSAVTPRELENRAKFYQETLGQKVSISMARALYFFYNKNLKITKLKLPKWGDEESRVDQVVSLEDAVLLDV